MLEGEFDLGAAHDLHPTERPGYGGPSGTGLLVEGLRVAARPWVQEEFRIERLATGHVIVHAHPDRIVSLHGHTPFTGAHDSPYRPTPTGNRSRLPRQGSTSVLEGVR